MGKISTEGGAVNCAMQKARGNPQAFYFNSHPKGNYILVFHEHSGGFRLVPHCCANHVDTF
jgi:hypothetical protein